MTPASFWADARRRATAVDRTVVRWWGVCAAFVVFDYTLLYVLIDVAGLSTPPATAIDVAVSTALRYLATDRYVFGQRLSRRRFGQFVVSSLGALLVWLVVTNGLWALGMHWFLAAVTGSVCSVLLNLVAHFRWIWRSR